MSITKHNPDILLQHFNIYSILEIQVLNENIKNYYIEAANKFNAKLFANPLDEGQHTLFPIIYSNDLLIPTYNSRTDIVPFNTQVKLKNTQYTKTSSYSNTVIRLIKTIPYLAPMISSKNNGIVEGTIFNCEDKDIQLSSFKPLLYIETWTPMIIKIVNNLNNENEGQLFIV